MRLICPNCSAQYEIDASMIPEDGRDVQCSNCGHTWYELPAPTASEVAAIAAEVEFTDAVSEEDDADGFIAGADDAGDAAPDDTPEDGTATEDDDDDAPAREIELAADGDDRGETDSDDDFFFDDDADEEEDAPASSRRESHPSYLSRADFLDDDDTSGASPAENDDDDAAPEEREEEDRTSQAIRAVTAPNEESGDAGETEQDLSEETEGDQPDDIEDEPGETEVEPEETEEDEPEDVLAARTPRRPADAAALDILREEAEREMSQRRAPPSESIETQTDLGLHDIRERRTPSRALRARMAHLGEDVPEDAEPDEKAAVESRPQRDAESDFAYEEPRRDLLPDIEEINSTLKPSQRKNAFSEARRRSGFRAGFLMMLFAAFALVFAYAQAPAIARARPEAEPSMIAFVDTANDVRDWIDGLIGN
jgi:predicted Zn finger-like uncharacterized protein